MSPVGSRGPGARRARVARLLPASAALVLAWVLLAALPIQAFAQEGHPDSASAPAAVSNQLPPTVQAGDTSTGAYHPAKSPGLAMLLSAVLPGAGQFYNESYWKVPVVTGFGIYFISNWLDNNRRYIDYRDKYRASLQENPHGDAIMLSNREFYKDQRDAFTWYFVILYFINIADAYVDANLYDFNVGSDLSLRRLPVLSPEPVRAIELTVRIGL